MKELGHSIRLAREPTLAEGVALRNAIADALSGLGAVVTPLPGRALKFHMPAPWRTGKPNPLFAVTGGQVDVSAGAGAGRRVRYSLSFTRLRAYGAVAVGLAAVVGFQWTRTALVATLLLAWLITFVVPAGHRVPSVSEARYCCGWFDSRSTSNYSREAVSITRRGVSPRKDVDKWSGASSAE